MKDYWIIIASFALLAIKILHEWLLHCARIRHEREKAGLPNKPSILKQITKFAQKHTTTISGIVVTAFVIITFGAIIYVMYLVKTKPNIYVDAKLTWTIAGLVSALNATATVVYLNAKNQSRIVGCLERVVSAEIDKEPSVIDKRSEIKNPAGLEQG